MTATLMQRALPGDDRRPSAGRHLWMPSAGVDGRRRICGGSVAPRGGARPGVSVRGFVTGTVGRVLGVIAGFAEQLGDLGLDLLVEAAPEFLVVRRSVVRVRILSVPNLRVRSLRVPGLRVPGLRVPGLCVRSLFVLVVLVVLVAGIGLGDLGE